MPDRTRWGKGQKLTRRFSRRRSVAAIEACEPRTLLSAISGLVFNDLNGNGTQDTGEGGLPASNVYLDLNQNSSYDTNIGGGAFTSSDVPRTIPDSGAVLSTDAVTGLFGSITHLSVTVNISQSNDSDLELDLISPAGTSVRLIDNVTDTGQNFTNTVLDDGASNAVENGSAPFTGTFRPSNPLHLFDGQNPDGTWQLRLQNFQPGDTGRLNSWSLNFTIGEPLAQTDVNGNYEFGSVPAGTYALQQRPQAGWTQTTQSPTVTVTDSADTNGVNFGDHQASGTISGTKFNDLNDNGVRDPGEPGIAGVTMYLDLNRNGLLDAGEPSTLTDSSGNWVLPVPGNGVYPVEEVAQSSWVQTTPAAGPIQVGPNVNVSRQLDSQSEGAIAIDKTNPNRLFMLSNEENATALFSGYSTDGGKTWTTRDLATGNDGLPGACCDPSTQFDAFGNLFIAYVNAAGDATEVAMSTDGGKTFNLIASFAGNSDQPTVVTGPGGATSPGSVWVTWTQNGRMVTAGAPVIGPGSVGSFGPVIPMPGTPGSLGDISVGPGGQLMEAWQADNTDNPEGPSTLYGSVDLNGLANPTFGPAFAITGTAVGTFHTIPAQSSRTIDAEAGLAWDRSGGAHNGRVYLVYTNLSSFGGADTDIFLRHSDDNGGTWSAPVRVNDDATHNSQFLPRISIDQTTGNLALSWYDCRNDLGNNGPGDTNGTPNDDTEYYATVSTDGGATFLPNLKISAGASNAADSQNAIDLGDYTGLDFYAGRFYPLWADNSNSTGDNPDPNGPLKTLDMYTAQVTFQPIAPAAYSVLSGPGQNVSGLLFGNHQIAASGVVGAALFYHNSLFDGNDPAANSGDDNAIPADKAPYVPMFGGGPASFTNISSYSKGINGIMIDATGLMRTPVAADFSFRVGNNNTPAAWPQAPAPAQIIDRAGMGAGGSDRVEIVWADGAILNTWLQVTVLANSDTGLASPYVFYFGSLVGTSGQAATAGSFTITSTDEQAARGDPHPFFDPAPINNLHDYNRDGKIDATDQIIARNNSGGSLVVLSLPAASPMLTLSQPRLVHRRTASAAASRLALPAISSTAHTHHPPPRPTPARPLARYHRPFIAKNHPDPQHGFSGLWSDVARHALARKRPDNTSR